MSQTSPAHNDFDSNQPHKPTDDKEEVYYEGSPRLRGELGKVLVYWLIGLLLIALPFIIRQMRNPQEMPHWIITIVLIALGLILMVWPVILMRSYRFRVTNYRIDFERGILGKKIDTLELWHVEDIQFRQSFLERILGVGTITIISNDDTTPKMPLIGVPNPRPLFDTLKQRVISVKRQRGVIKMDVGGHVDAGG